MNNKKIRYFYMNAAEVMDTTIDIFKKSFFVQIGYNLIVSIISSIVIFILAFFSLLFFSAVILASGFSFESTPTASLIITLSVFGLVVVFAYLLMGSVTSTGNVILANDTFKGKKPNLNKTLSLALKKIPAVFSIVFAQIILFLPFLAVIATSVYAYVMLIEALDLMIFSVVTLLLFILITAVFLFLVIALLSIFQTIVFLSIPVCIFEKKYFFSAIFRSFELVKKNFLRILATVVLWQLSITMFSLGISLFMAFAARIVDLVLPSQIAFVLSMFMASINYIVVYAAGIVVAPLGGVFINTMYINRKIKCEGYDITMYLEEEV